MEYSKLLFRLEPPSGASWCASARFAVRNTEMSVVSRAQSDQAQSDQGGRCCQERRSSMLPRRHSFVLMPCGLSSWHRLSIIVL